MYLPLILNLIFYFAVVVKASKEESDDDGDVGTNLVMQLRNDVNLDLSEDQEYEDLRAEFLAYHSALASLTETSGRRSMKSTPCWQRNGICINHNLCVGFNSLSEVPGCKAHLQVCCFVWDKYEVRDQSPHGITMLSYPWKVLEEFGGKGIVEKEVPEEKPKKLKKKSALRTGNDRLNSVALFLYK